MTDNTIQMANSEQVQKMDKVAEILGCENFMILTSTPNGQTAFFRRGIDDFQSVAHLELVKATILKNVLMQEWERRLGEASKRAVQ